MENVFRALADRSRRLLLDRLYERDGLSLAQLETALPGMTRFGVMKHLRVLEAAGLVVAHKVGREKLHYLNAVPIRQVHDRWLDKFTARTAAALIDLQRALEQEESAVNGHTPPSHVFQIVIRTTPERLWRALTDPADTTRYYFGFGIESDWQPGSAYTMGPDGQVLISGEVLAVEPARRLVTTFEGRFNDDIAAHPPTRVTYEIEPLGEACKLTVIHEGLTTDRPGTAGLLDGWVLIISGLKTLLETGEPMLAAA